MVRDDTRLYDEPKWSDGQTLIAYCKKCGRETLHTFHIKKLSEVHVNKFWTCLGCGYKINLGTEDTRNY